MGPPEAVETGACALSAVGDGGGKRGEPLSNLPGTDVWTAKEVVTPVID